MRQRLFSVLSGSAVLFFGLLVPAAVVRAEIVVSSFEEAALAGKLVSNNSYEGETEAASTFRSGNVTFANDGVFFGGSTWSGVGISRKTAMTGANFYDESNDLIAKPLQGAGGSATWGVIGTFGTLTADAGYIFQSLSISNTLWAWTSMKEGDPFAGGPFGNGQGTGRFTGMDDFFTVRFTNPDTNQFADFNLADFRGTDDYIVDDWRNLNLSSLQASQLNVSFLGSRETGFGTPPTYFLDTPAYAAIDNVAVGSVAAVPEPSSLALLAAAGSAGAWFRCRRRRRTSQAA